VDDFEVVAHQLEFYGLALAQRFDQFACQLERVPDLGLLDVLPVGDALFDDHLQGSSVGSID
jgi:hypothetical protein